MAYVPSYTIEILTVTSSMVSAAFYFGVPNILAAAANPSAAQFGTRLDAADVAALQAGTLYGEVVQRNIVGMAPSNIAAFLITEYNSYGATALANYQAKYTNAQYEGWAYNGTAWSAP